MSKNNIRLRLNFPAGNEQSAGRHFWNTDGSVVAELLKLAKHSSDRQFNELLRMIQHAKMIELLYGVEEKIPENN